VVYLALEDKVLPLVKLLLVLLLLVLLWLLYAAAVEVMALNLNVRDGEQL
jgi:hypothetical protein